HNGLRGARGRGVAGLERGPGTGTGAAAMTPGALNPAGLDRAALNPAAGNSAALNSAEYGQRGSATTAGAKVPGDGPGGLHDSAGQFGDRGRRQQSFGRPDQADRTDGGTRPVHDGRRYPRIADRRLLVLQRIASPADLSERLAQGRLGRLGPA